MPTIPDLLENIGNTSDLPPRHEMVIEPTLMNEWHVVATTTDIEEGEIFHTKLLEEDIVVWRKGTQIAAWQDLCIHRATPLSEGRIVDNNVQCKYHGWTYDISGAVVVFPSDPDKKPGKKARIHKRYWTQEQYGLVWVSPGQYEQKPPIRKANTYLEPNKPVVPFPEWEDSSYRKVLCGPYHVRAAAPLVVENFLDVSHLAVVHAGTLGDANRPAIPPYQVKAGPEGIVATNVRIWQPNPFGTGVPGFAEYTYRVPRPLTVLMEKESDGRRLSILFVATPVAKQKTIGWTLMAMNYDHHVPEAELVDWQDQIMAQDVAILERQVPQLLETDMQSQVNLPSDRLSIEYKRALSRVWDVKFGTTYGYN